MTHRSSTPTLAPPAARTARPLAILHLRGSEATMGRQHAELLQEIGDYQPVIDFYPRMPELAMDLEGRLPGWALRCVRPALGHALTRLESRRPASARARSAAFFEQLGMDPAFARNLFVMDLLQNVVGLAGALGLGPSARLAARAAAPACSSLVAWGRATRGGELLHARNFDFPGAGVWERRPTVVFCAPDEGLRYGFVTARGADVPGITGFNEAGLSITAHTCFHRHVGFTGRGVVDLTHEIVRRASTLQDALRIARERAVASSWCLVVSSAAERSAVALEVNGRGVVPISPGDGEPFLASANQYRSAAMRRGQIAPAAAFVANSDGRYAALRARARAAVAAGGLTPEDLEELLGSRRCPEVPGVERASGGVLASPISVQSVVLQPEARACRVSTGPCPTGLGPYVTVPWSWDEPVGAEVRDTGRELPGAGTPAEEAYGEFLRAVTLDGQGAGAAQVDRCLERAVELDPADPTYRFLLGGVRLRQGEPSAAARELEAALDQERATFPRGQLHLWAARAHAAAGRPSSARSHRAELAQLGHPLLEDDVRAARREARRPLSAKRLRRVTPNLVFPDLMLA